MNRGRAIEVSTQLAAIHVDHVLLCSATDEGAGFYTVVVSPENESINIGNLYFACQKAGMNIDFVKGRGFIIECKPEELPNEVNPENMDAPIHCIQCATLYDSALGVCPICGTAPPVFWRASAQYGGGTTGTGSW